ncbi:MAG TPA: DUF3108 domain-containing protein [Gammaproteobacteria bacterium]|nr:DUF3108 domain-containing protein [Gammaproteobacteria bacterium]
MKRLILALVVATLMALPTWLPAVEQIPDFSARYTVEKAGLNVISMTTSLKHSPSKLEYQSAAEPIGMAAWFFDDYRIYQYSDLKQVTERVIPLEYRYTFKGSGQNRDEQYVYDWQHHVAHVNYRGEEKTLKIPNGTLDNSSLQLALMLDARQGEKKITHPVISKGELKTYTFTNLGREAVETPLGAFEAIKLERRKNDEENTTYTTWYAPKLHYLPVKVENCEDGDVVLSLSLEEVRWL